ncbi:MAG: hypothetical protein JNK74_22950 [Candidatus Hydrogenedentes bacterium]|nr:hypothetical protein [Candidatus Hydrogenedentota bacterium]
MSRKLFGSATAPAILLASLLMWAAGMGLAAAQEGNDITLRLGSTTGNAGDAIEVTVTMEADDILPESLVLFLAYDPAVLTPVEDAYELVLRDALSGEPILDGEGNTIATFSALRPSENLRGSGKSIDSETYGDEGVLGVSIQGLNMLEIAPGELFTVAFQVAEDAAEGTTTEIAGVSEGAEVLIPDGNGGVTAVATSAARSVETSPGNFEVVDVTYRYEDVAVPIGCVPPVAPGGVTATQNRSDSVFVSWSAVAGAGIEYRVYRNTANNAATAAPIGEGWQAEATFSDITALVPEVVPGEGCNAPDTLREVRYFYWVKARSEEGCESPLSAAPAEGFRTAGSARFAAMGTLFASAVLLLALSTAPMRPKARSGA